MDRPFCRKNVSLWREDSRKILDRWPEPTVIVSDGAYGLGLFPGDPKDARELRGWYAAHLQAWSKRAVPRTTLWFWGTERSWGTVHSMIEDFGWRFRSLSVWNKGIEHIAGNVNTGKMRTFPVVTEVCAHYVFNRGFGPNGQHSLQWWLRDEWDRADLTLKQANEACGVDNAASRKYLTQDDVWYAPPWAHMKSLIAYAARHGKPVPRGHRPYFSMDGRAPIDRDQWAALRARFACPFAVTNVWDRPTLRGEERIKSAGKGAIHANQKPLDLMERIIVASSEPGDVVWEPFGGLFSASVAAVRTGRRAYGAEVDPTMFEAGTGRFGGVAKETARGSRQRTRKDAT